MAKNGDETDIIRLAYSIERLLEHPFARAIVEKAEEMKLEALDVENFACLIGTGVSANVGGQTFYAGKPEFFEDLGGISPIRWISIGSEARERLSSSLGTLIASKAS